MQCFSFSCAKCFWRCRSEKRSWQMGKKPMAAMCGGSDGRPSFLGGLVEEMGWVVKPLNAVFVLL